MRLSCAACGPGSLWGEPHPGSQCVLSRDGCKPWEVGQYVKCTACNSKYSPDCLRKLSKKVHEYEHRLSTGESLHDPQGVWKMLKLQPWQEGIDAKVLSECCAAGFHAKTSSQCAAIPHCFACEQGTIPEPAPSAAAQVYKMLDADCEGRVVLLLPFEEQLLSGEMQELKVRVVDFVESHPVIPAELCKPLFQGGEGTEAEMGCARSRMSCPPPPPPTA